MPLRGKVQGVGEFDFSLDGQAIVYLLYRTAVDLRIRLILSRLGFSVKTVSTMDKLLEAPINGPCPIVVVDVASNLDDGIRTVEKLRQQRNSWLIIPVCSEGSIDFFRSCFNAGSADVLDKSFDDERISEAFYVIKSLTLRQSSPLVSARERQRQFNLLSPRERDVFRYLVQGLTSREVGQRLAISTRTIDLHRAHLHKKLRVRNVAQMAGEYSEFLERS